LNELLNRLFDLLDIVVPDFGLLQGRSSIRDTGAEDLLRARKSEVASINENLPSTHILRENLGHVLVQSRLDLIRSGIRPN
jgi:hypothetical protein